MKWICVLACSLFLSTTAFPGFANAEAREQADQEPVWSFGAGIGFGPTVVYNCSPGLASLAEGSARYGYGGFGSLYLSSPQGQFLVERRLSPSFSLMLKLSALYSDHETNQADHVWQGTSKGFGVATGLRWILNPGGIVEVSTYLALHGAWSWSNGTSEDDEGEWAWNDHGYDVGATVGLVLERELLENLFLRVESSLVNVSYTWLESDVDGSAMTTSKGLSAGLVLRPAVQLRLLF